MYASILYPNGQIRRGALGACHRGGGGGAGGTVQISQGL